MTVTTHDDNTRKLLQDHAPQVNPEDIRLFRKFAEEHPELLPNDTSPDYQIRKREELGLAEAFLKFNGQIYVNVPLYMQILAKKVA